MILLFKGLSSLAVILAFLVGAMGGAGQDAVLVLWQVIPDSGPITFPQTFDTDLLMWSALVSQVLPLIVARIVGTEWHKDRKIAATIGICLIASVVTSALLGRLQPANLATSMLIVFTLTSIMYKQVWKGSEVVARLEAA